METSINMNSELQQFDMPKNLLVKIVAYIELNIWYITEAIPIIYYYDFLFFHAVPLVNKISKYSPMRQVMLSFYCSTETRSSSSKIILSNFLSSCESTSSTTGMADSWVGFTFLSSTGICSSEHQQIFAS